LIQNFWGTNSSLVKQHTSKTQTFGWNQQALLLYLYLEHFNDSLAEHAAYNCLDSSQNCATFSRRTHANYQFVLARANKHLNIFKPLGIGIRDLPKSLTFEFKLVGGFNPIEKY